MKLPIKQKILLACGIPVVLLVIFGFTGYTLTRSVMHDASHAINFAFHAEENVMEGQSNYLRCAWAIDHITHAEENSQIILWGKRFDAGLNEFLETYSELERSGVVPNELLDQAKSAFKRMEESGHLVLSICETHPSDKAHDPQLNIAFEQFTQAVAELDEAFEAIEVGVGDFVGTRAMAQESVHSIFSHDQRTNITMISLVAFGFLFSLLAVFWLVRSVSRPLRSVTSIARRISVGDVDQTVTISGNDEIGQLEASFKQTIDYLKELADSADRIAANDLRAQIIPHSPNDRLSMSFIKMQENLRAIVTQLAEDSRRLNTAAFHIAAASSTVLSGAKEQHTETGHVSNAMETISKTIQEAVNVSERVAELSRTASERARTGTQTVEEAISEMNQISNVVQQSAKTISELSKSSQEIGQIVSVIDDIADQTNLLALNATIEAARAGDLGRGFAVVADEVRKLAERTSKATNEISAMIRSVQTSTSEIVTSMQSGLGEFNSGRQLVNKAGESLREILDASNRVLEMTALMANSTKDQSLTATQISKAVQHISNITERSTSEAAQSANAAKGLTEQAERLNQLVGKFSVSS